MKLNYSSYLQLDKLLDSQKPLSSPAVHDELLFICTHQAFEIWFKVIISEINHIIELLNKGGFKQTAPHLQRIVAIIELFPAHIRVLETMSPQEFLKFRDNLMPASGLQSLQFRRVEFLLGMADSRYAAMFNNEESAQLKKDSETNLWNTFLKTINKKYDLKISDRNSQMDSIKQIYNQNKFEDAKEFCENLIELDESLLKWRNAHALLAERMIGYKPGTGKEDVQKITQKGSFEEGGVKYLRDMTMKKAFPLLWEARTYLT